MLKQVGVKDGKWTKKSANKSYFGYKLHIKIGNKPLNNKKKRNTKDTSS
jgi:hypothetical protein